MQGWTAEAAREFCLDWLPAWTGGEPARLAAFYTEDVFYSDPTVPDGVSGKPAFTRYLAKLLGNNPGWVWTHVCAVPLEDGFLNHWRADIPVGPQTITCRGVCSVQLRGGLIYRNRVYFDTLALRTAIDAWNRQRRAS